jgi:hypothetical protein
MVGQVKKPKDQKEVRPEVIERWLRIYEARARAGFVPLSILDALKKQTQKPLE